MQVLAHNPELEVYSDATGNYVRGFLIGTKFNNANWKINKTTGHDLIKKFEGTDFAIIPQLINKPLSEGGGGHYFGQDTTEDLLKGYAEHSHGKYHKILGPYSYNDGTDDYYYDSIIKLRDSKAAAELIKHGSKTWEPFSISPHIMPRKGPDTDIYDWIPIGGALVIKGAYGPQAVISKLCKGTSAQCEKSLGAATLEYKSPYGDIKLTDPLLVDDGLSKIISSIVSKVASTQTYMTESKGEATPSQPVVTQLTAEVAKPNATVNAQEAITSAKLTQVVTPEQFAEAEKRNQELEKVVTELRNKDKLNTLNNLLIKVKDEKAKEELIKKYSKLDNVDQIKEILNDFLPVLKASEAEEEKEEEKDGGNKPQGQEASKKSKGASLPKEPEIPAAEESSKAASVPVNKLQVIRNFMNSGGRS